MMNLCQVLSWIAFRDDKLITSDPDKLRRDMRRYRKRLIEPNPARDFLKAAQTGQLIMQIKGVSPVNPAEWADISEAELWEIVESQWAKVKKIQ